MTVRFIIDEASIDLNGVSVVDGLDLIEGLLDLIDDARSQDGGVCYDDQLFQAPLVANFTFWDLCDPQSPIPLPREVQERAAAVFGAMPRWYELDAVVPLTFDVSVNCGAIESTRSVAWAHQQAKAGELGSVACLCIPGTRRTGAVKVALSGHIETIWFVKSANEMEGFYRWLLSKYATHPDQIAELASCAFTKLEFAEGCFDGINNMSKTCRQMAPAIVKHLSALSDEGQRIFKGSWARAPQEFGSFGIDISDENGGTKRNPNAKKQHKRVVNGRELYFWWHTKIERHQDRIYVCPDDVPKEGRIIVGIFCKHLQV